MILKPVEPASDFSHPTRIPRDITLKDDPKRQAGFFDPTLLSENPHQPWSKVFTASLVSIPSTRFSRFPFDPSILSFDFDVESLACIRVDTLVIRGYAMIFDALLWNINFGESFIRKADIQIDLTKFFWPCYNFERRAFKEFIEDIEERPLGNNSFRATNILPCVSMARVPYATRIQKRFSNMVCPHLHDCGSSATIRAPSGQHL